MRRGEIHNRGRKQQILDFSGLLLGKITPTDIDGLIEYHNKLFILMEAKYGSAPLPFGQKLALERLCDSLDKDKPSIIFISRHILPSENDVDMSETLVDCYYWKGRWEKVCKNIKLGDAIKGFISKNSHHQSKELSKQSKKNGNVQ